VAASASVHRPAASEQSGCSKWCRDQTLPVDRARVLRTQHPKDAIEDTMIVCPRNATRLVGQHRLDGKPFIIGEFVAHDPSPQFGSLNHRRPAKRAMLSAPAGLRRFREKADINQPTPPAKSIENDPFRTSRASITYRRISRSIRRTDVTSLDMR
jgi:hypothetical protein